jgi:putative membrane protein
MATLPASPPTPAAPDAGADRAFFVFTAVFSAAALSLLAYILLLRDAGATATWNLRFMPAVNAGLNTAAATLLALGWRAIRKGERRQHQYLMVGAFVASSLFLVGYLAYHFVHGDTRFVGVGAVRAFYFFILISHILLSVPIVPMALLAFYFAWRQSFTRHRKVTRLLAPIWLYVSVTGVLIYVLLRASYAAAAGA